MVAARRPFRLIARAWVRLRSPLVVSQVAASSSGALVMLVGAASLEGAGLASLGVLTLVLSILMGLVRSGLYQPALLAGRSTGATTVTPLYAATAAVASALVFVSAAWIMSPGTAGLIVGALSVLPLIQDWLRHNAIGSGELWVVAKGDIVRLVATGVFLAIASVASEPTPLQLVGAGVLGHGIGALPLVVARAWHGLSQPYSQYWMIARSQSAEFVISQLASSVPMLILGIPGSSLLVGPLRLAQTLLGPLNLIFSAITTNLLRFTAEGGDVEVDREIIREGRTQARAITAISVSIVAPAIALVVLGDISLGAVPANDLALSLFLTGAVLVGSGFSGCHATVMRLLLRQDVVTRSRLGVVALATVGYVVGYVIGSGDGSLVAGLLVTAIAFPLIFGLATRRIYPGFEGG